MAGPFEDVLADALVAHDLEGPAGFQRIVDAHPEHAERLRTHVERLRAFGLVNRDTQVAPLGPPDERFPEQLGEFRLLQRLGGGGMGVVYLAEQASLRRRVALKLVRSEHLYYPGATERFRREVEAVAKLQHPGIVPVFGAGEDAGVPWLAMEHVVGASLDEIVRRLAGRDPARLAAADLRQAIVAIVASRTGAVAESQAAATAAPTDPHGAFVGTWVDACLRIARSVAAALQHAHERGVLHRDVKPSNVMLTLDGRALLLDFGLATSQGSTRLTGTNSQMGSPAYMSPEQMRGDARRLDVRTDVYSLGVTLYELLTLRMPFAGESAASTRDLVLAGRPAPLRLLNRTVTRDADVVCRKAMDVDAARRYATAAAFAADLDCVLTLRPIAARPPSTWLKVRRAAQRHPARATAALAAVLLFGVAPSVFLLQQRAANRSVRDALAQAQQQRDRARLAVDTMLTRVANEALFELPRMLPVRADLLASARTFYEQFLAEAADDPELRAQAADTALRLASVEIKLGRVEGALAATARAETLARSLTPAEAPGLLRHALLVKGSVLHSQARLDEALAAFTAAREACEQTLRATPDDADAHADRLAIERAHAMILGQLQRPDEAIAAYRRMSDLWQAAQGVTPGTGQHLAAFVERLCAFADETELHQLRGDAQATAEALLDSEELLADAPADALPITGRLAVAKLGIARARLAAAAGDLAAGERHFRTTLASSRELLREYPDYASALRQHAALLNDLAMLVDKAETPGEEAMALFTESIATLRRLIEQDPGVTENRANLAASLTNVGSRLQDRRQPQAARAMFEEALDLASAALAEAPTRHNWRLVVHNTAWFLGQVCGELGDPGAQAAAAERLAASMPDQARTLRVAAGLLAQAITALGKDAAATPTDREKRQRELEQRAMQWLQDAARLGCADHEWLATSDEFAPLRSLPGFAAVLQQVEANAARTKK